MSPTAVIVLTMLVLTGTAITYAVYRKPALGAAMVTATTVVTLLYTLLQN
ncbi:hypothetical protein ACFQ6B_37745 [Streptomyces wedmorensis]|uniref:Uncharacterized protein n=1 Tax=Streptomyces wedmorensis TaxID=43759 RepID=A0ABW6J1A3_STRWE